MSKIPVPSLPELVQVLGLPFGPIDDGIAANDPDPGYFGPDSVTWRVMREPGMVFGGIRALLMQAAHPMVAEGALKFSRFKEQPYDRFIGTAEWVGTVVFGTTEQADSISAHVRAMHEKVNSHLDPLNATERKGARAGAPYSALSPQLDKWVHATLVETLLVTHRALVGTLSADEEDRFVREWNPIGRMMGMRAQDEFGSYRDLQEYIRHEIRHGAVKPSAASREVAQVILRTNSKAIPQPVWRQLSQLSLGMLPDDVRKSFGITWHAWDRAQYHGACTAIKHARQALPPSLRESRSHRAAMTRVRNAGPDIGL